MQKDKRRFTAVGGEYLGEEPLTAEQKNDAKRTAAYLRSLKKSDKPCKVVVSR